ncbi:hypothetical protein vseg_018732 [Gypsophila vaccaria]
MHGLTLIKPTAAPLAVCFKGILTSPCKWIIWTCHMLFRCQFFPPLAVRKHHLKSEGSDWKWEKLHVMAFTSDCRNPT